MTRSPEAVRKMVLWTAWPLIALGILALILALPMWIFYSVILTPDILVDMRRDPALAAFPAEIWALVASMPLLLEITMVTALLTMVIAIGVLTRKLWGYYGLLACFWLGVPANVAGIFWHWVFVDRIHPSMAAMMEQLSLPAFLLDYWTVQLSGVTFGLVFAVGFGWSAWQWQHADVKSYFSDTTPSSGPKP
ncbi:MAG: hypothetical protein IPK97_06395 [Ahniella sp.]|nr:hypothetical protein [Ahniella sp.]